MRRDSLPVKTRSRIDEMNGHFDVDDFVPGIFHLDLNINTRKYDSQECLATKSITRKISCQDRADNARRSHIRDLTLRYNSLCSDLNNCDVPSPESTLVFLGALATHLGKNVEAVQHFEGALKKNDSNLSALAGLICIHSKNSTTQEKAADYKKTIADLLGRSDVDVNDDELSYRISCCMADQAYAFAYDVGLTTYEERMDRFLSSMEFYDRALAIGSSVITLDEKRRWSLSLASIIVSQDGMMLKHGEEEANRLSRYNRAINIFSDLIKSDSIYQAALGSAYMGVLLERQASFETTPMSIHDCGLTTCEPVDCYSKSIEVAEKNSTVLNRLATIYQSSGKVELALGAADMSIRLSPDSMENPNAYHIRARLQMELYMRDLTKCKLGHGGIPNRELLEKAKDDLERILKASDNNMSIFIDIGQVCYFMGVDAFKESFIVDEENVNSALVFFSKALQCDVGNMIPQLQILRGKCLKIKGEDRNALECFKRAIELEKTGCSNAQAFRWLMETLLNWFSTGTIERKDSVAEEIDGWVQIAQGKYAPSALSSVIRTLTQLFTQELLDLAKFLVRAQKLTLTRICLTAFSVKEHGIGLNSSSSADVMR